MPSSSTSTSSLRNPAFFAAACLPYCPRPFTNSPSLSFASPRVRRSSSVRSVRIIPPKAIARIGQVPTRREMSDFARQPAGSVKVNVVWDWPRFTVAGTGPDSGARCRAQAKSAMDSSNWPPSVLNSSPTRTPAFAAMLPGATDFTFATWSGSRVMPTVSGMGIG